MRTTLKIAGSLFCLVLAFAATCLGQGGEEGIPLGGNCQQAYLTTKGTVVTDRYGPLSELEEMVSTLRSVSQQKKFVPIKSLELYPSNELLDRYRLRVEMEYMGLSSSGKRLKSYGTMNQMGLLRDLPTRQRTEAARRALQLAAEHPDGHPLNIMFREKLVATGEIVVEVYQVDPYPRLPSRADMLKLVGSSEQFQHTGSFQTKMLRKLLDLPELEHPYMRQAQHQFYLDSVVGGYGKAAERSIVNGSLPCGPAKGARGNFSKLVRALKGVP